MIKCSSHGVWVVEGGAGHANSGKLNEQELCVHVTKGVRKQENKSSEEGNTQLGNTIKSWRTWGLLSRFGGVAGTWHNLAYSPRCPREPNMPNCTKLCQVPCHLPDVLSSNYMVCLFFFLQVVLPCAYPPMPASPDPYNMFKVTMPSHLGED